MDDGKIKAKIESNSYITGQEFAKQFNVCHATIENHIRHLGLVEKLHIWVPNELKEIQTTNQYL